MTSAYHLGRNGPRETYMLVGVLSRCRQSHVKKKSPRITHDVRVRAKVPPPVPARRSLCSSCRASSLLRTDFEDLRRCRADVSSACVIGRSAERERHPLVETELGHDEPRENSPARWFCSLPWCPQRHTQRGVYSEAREKAPEKTR